MDPGRLVKSWLATDLDTWTRAVLHRTFHPDTGAPYWLARRAELPFDPLALTEYRDLAAFGPFDLGTLRCGDPTDLVPLAVPRPLTGRVWESGGTTGSPCAVFYTPDMLLHRGAWRRWSFVTEGFRPHRRWLQATPTGPHLIGNGVWETSELYASVAYAIDMDPRWVKRLLRTGKLAQVGEYTAHLVDQITETVRARGIHYLNTTPALFVHLVRTHPDVVADLDGVRLSGTQLTAAMYTEFATALAGGLLGVSYGNTFGNAACAPVTDPTRLIYLPNYPHVTMTVVDPRDSTVQVPFGTAGRVRLTVLHPDLFLPNILERDEAIRVPPPPGWPCEAVANVHPLQVIATQPEGIY